MKSAIITSACLFLTTALATPAGFSEYPNIQRRAAGDDTYLGRLYINKNCNKTKKDLINQAWSEAGMLARAHNLWVPKKDYQPAMDMYMGTKSVQDPWFFGKSYKKLIQGNIKRQYDLHTGNYPYRTYTYIYCGDKEKSTSRCALKKGFAYEKDEIGHWYGYTNHLITLCDRFFIEKGPLQPILNQGDKGNNTMKEKIDAYKFAQAWTLFHETYHMEDTVGRPAVIDVLDGKCYGAKRVFEIARDNNAELSYINAESYAAAATAILVQKRWNLKTPPRPGACMSGNSCVKALSDDLPPGEEEGAVLTGTNEGWTSPTFDTSKTTEPPESDWERANPPTLDPKLYFGSDYQEDPKIDLTPDKCFSKDQNATFAKDSDLREKIIAFCGGQKGKEVGKDNKLSTNYGILNSKRSILPLFTRSPPTGSLTLSVEWNDNWDCNNHPFLLSQDECETALVKSVLEKCDDGKNDKAGGYKNLGCGKYTVSVQKTATQPQPNPLPVPADPNRPSLCYTDKRGANSPAVETSILKSNIEPWCDALVDSHVNKVTPAARNMRALFPVKLTTGKDGTAWAGAELIGDKECTISREDCKEGLMGRCVNGCDTSGSTKRGGIDVMGCARYYVWVEEGKPAKNYYTRGTDAEENAKPLGPA